MKDTRPARPGAPGAQRARHFAIAELGLDIRCARVQTLGQEVVDAFYLLGPNGQKLTDPHALDAVEVAVLYALDTAP